MTVDNGQLTIIVSLRDKFKLFPQEKPQLSIVNFSMKKAFVSQNKRQRPLLPLRYHSRSALCAALCFGCIGPARCGLLACVRRSAHCSEGISFGGSYRLTPTGGSLKGAFPGSCPRPGIAYKGKFTCGWGRSSGRIADSGLRNGWWWCRSPGDGALP